MLKQHSTKPWRVHNSCDTEKKLTQHKGTSLHLELLHSIGCELRGFPVDERVCALALWSRQLSQNAPRCTPARRRLRRMRLSAGGTPSSCTPRSRRGPWCCWRRSPRSPRSRAASGPRARPPSAQWPSRRSRQTAPFPSPSRLLRSSQAAPARRAVINQADSEAPFSLWIFCSWCLRCSWCGVGSTCACQLRKVCKSSSTAVIDKVVITHAAEGCAVKPHICNALSTDDVAHTHLTPSTLAHSLRVRGE